MGSVVSRIALVLITSVATTVGVHIATNFPVVYDAMCGA